MLKWMKRGEVVTPSRMKEALQANLPDAAMDRLWITNTLTKNDVAAIEAALKATKPKPTKKAAKKKEGDK
jgi:hypothetical protein